MFKFMIWLKSVIKKKPGLITLEEMAANLRYVCSKLDAILTLKAVKMNGLFLWHNRFCIPLQS